ncbi:MAG: hypothetical protein H8D78_08335 [Chloroflexi bacterium]|nr:hypothetical protein [Chloroflexota bacterium]
MTQAEMVAQLQARAKRTDRYNLILVAMPLATAHRDAEELAQALDAKYVDFDRELIARMEADDWDYHVEVERAGDLSEGRRLAEALIQDIANRLDRERPTVIGNCSLVVRYQVDLAAELLPASSRGLCVICAGGRVLDDALCVHGTFKFVGAGIVPALEVVEDN